MRAVKMLASSANLQHISKITSQTVRTGRFLYFLEECLLSRGSGSNTLFKGLFIKSIRDRYLLLLIIFHAILFRNWLLLFETTLWIHSFCVSIRIKYGIFEILSCGLREGYVSHVLSDLLRVDKGFWSFVLISLTRSRSWGCSAWTAI
jgi:hypothetical protein